MAMDATAQVLRFYEALSTGDVEMIEQVLAPDWEAIPALASGGRGPTGFRELAGFLRGVFPDLTVTVEDVVAAGDRVAVRATVRGTHSAELMGVPATGRAVEYRAFEIHRLEDGRLAQLWHVQDYLSVLRQVGATFVTDSDRATQVVTWSRL